MLSAVRLQLIHKSKYMLVLHVSGLMPTLVLKHARHDLLPDIFVLKMLSC